MSVDKIMVVDSDGETSTAQPISAVVRKELKRARKKDREQDDGWKLAETFSDLNVLNMLQGEQQAIVGILNAPPRDAAGAVVGAVGPVYTAREQAVLRWCTNAIVRLSVSLFNLSVAERAETMLAFLEHGLKSKKNNNMFGGVGGLFILSSLTGGGFGFSPLFGAGPGYSGYMGPTAGPVWGGLG